MIPFYNYLDCVDSYMGFFCEDRRYLTIVGFDPITGEKIKKGFDAYGMVICTDEFHGKERGNKRAIKKRLLECVEEWKAFHEKKEECPRLYDLVIGDDVGTSRAAYLPMIRAYVIYKSWSDEDLRKQKFYAMDYCPFCGAEFPDRLDDKLTEILQTEYGLNSWRDYKKAPHEFHTDEWWKKRGL